jgi:hypothetical protein
MLRGLLLPSCQPGGGVSQEAERATVLDPGQGGMNIVELFEDAMSCT